MERTFYVWRRYVDVLLYITRVMYRETRLMNDGWEMRLGDARQEMEMGGVTRGEAVARRWRVYNEGIWKAIQGDQPLAIKCQEIFSWPTLSGSSFWNKEGDISTRRR
jgi:hypothetical protein